jgi:hypothetical protein
MKKRMMMALAAGALVAAMMPGVAVAQPASWDLHWTVTDEDCDGSGLDGFDVLLTATGGNGKWVNVEVEFTFLINGQGSTESGVVRGTADGIAGYGWHFGTNSVTSASVDLRGRTVKPNGTPTGEWVDAPPMVCTYA